MNFLIDQYDSPLGRMLLVTDPQSRVRALEFADGEERMRHLLRVQYGPVDLRPASAPQPVTDALHSYFTGEFAEICRVTVKLGGTSFQREVWQALRTIPAGSTRTYGEIARQIGRPKASRAVGAANGANPISIILPCHRVIGASGSLTGYGGGLHRKQWLLDHESEKCFSITPPHAGILTRKQIDAPRRLG